MHSRARAHTRAPVCEVNCDAQTALCGSLAGVESLKTVRGSLSGVSASLPGAILHASLANLSLSRPLSLYIYIFLSLLYSLLTNQCGAKAAGAAQAEERGKQGRGMTPLLESAPRTAPQSGQLHPAPGTAQQRLPSRQRRARHCSDSG